MHEPLDGMILLRFASLAGRAVLIHAITSKPWNMACHCGPQTHLACERRRRLCEAVGLPFERLTCAEQVHGASVAVISPDGAGAGRDGRASAVAGVDGLLTDCPGVGLMLLSADCPLVLVFDPRRPAIGVAHASWRGTVGRISGRLVEQMTHSFGSVAEELWAGIGPSAGPESYVVGDDVFRSAADSLPDHDRYFRPVPGGMTFDLWAANRDTLVSAGLRRDHIEVAGVCTIKDDRFFSHRREGSQTGRFALIAGLRTS